MRYIRFILGGLAGLLLVTAVAAQTIPSNSQGQSITSQTQSVSGTVTASTAKSLEIKKEDATTMTFVVDAQSSIPQGITAGQPAQVEYRSLPGGALEAARVTVNSSPGPGGQADDQASADPPSAASGAAAGSASPEAGSAAMPRTASPLPLLALTGLLALGASAGLHLVQRR